MRSGAPRESGLSTSHTNGGEGNETTLGEPRARFARARGRPRLRRGGRIRGYGHAGVAGPRERWARDDGRDLPGGFWAGLLIHCWRNLDRDARRQQHLHVERYDRLLNGNEFVGRELSHRQWYG